MIVTREDAKRIIRKHYGQDFKYRISTKVSIGVLPCSDSRDMLAWQSIDKGTDSAVRIGRMTPAMRVDWEWERLYTLRATNQAGETVYWTGSSGDAWISKDKGRAFYGYTLTGIERKAELFNRMTDIHGLTFEPEQATI